MNSPTFSDVTTACRYFVGCRLLTSVHAQPENFGMRAFIILVMLHVFPLAQGIAIPICQIEPDGIDVGAIPLGKTQEWTFQLSNKGDQDLHLTLQSRSCGCQILSLPPSVPPGSKADVKIAFTPKEDRFGALAIAIRTNAPNKQVVLIRVAYRAVKAVYAEQTKISANTSSAGKEQSISLKVLGAEPSTTFSLISVQPNVEWLQIASPEKFPSDGQSQHTITVRILPTRPASSKGTLIIRTDNDEVPILEIPITGSSTDSQGSRESVRGDTKEHRDQ